MRIEVKGRNLPVSDDLREHVAKRFRKVDAAGIGARRARGGGV